MAKFVICRSFVTRMRWTVEAPNEEAALAMLDHESSHDDQGSTPWDLGDEEWLGPYSGTTAEENEDASLELEDAP